MTNPPVALPAQFAFLTEPTPGHVVLDLHTEQGVARAIRAKLISPSHCPCCGQEIAR